jgi:hypothetical protein
MSPTEPHVFELGLRERLIWSGVPNAGIVFRGSDLTQIPISIIVLFIFASKYRNASHDGALGGIIWGALFAAVLYFLVGRFLYDALRRRRSVYAITSDRVLIINTVWSRFVKSFALSSITDIKLDEGRNGVGNIWLGRRYLPPGWQDPRLMPSRTSRNAFEILPDAKHVYELLLEAHQASLASLV